MDKKNIRELLVRLAAGAATVDEVMEELRAEPFRAASLFRVVPDNLLLVNMRPVEGENAVMLQLREIGGRTADFSVTSDKLTFTDVTVCDVVGEPLRGESASLTFRPWENKFIKLAW